MKQKSYRRLLERLIPACALLAGLTPAVATEYWVATTGNNANTGTSTAPFATITHALTKAVNPGDIVTVKGGVYRNEKARFGGNGTAAAPITLRGAPGETVTIKGSTVVPSGSWSLYQGSIYKAPWDKYFGSWDSRFLDDDLSNDPNQRGNKGRNQFFVNGQIVEEVGRMDWLKENSFYIDNAANIVYIWLPGGANPATKTIEAANQQDTIISSWGADHIVIRGINIEHLANSPQGSAAIRISSPYGGYSGTPSDNVTIEDVSISWVSGSALSVGGTNQIIRNCKLNDNGQNGLHVSGAKNSVFEDIEYKRNNRHPGKAFDVGWEAVMKVAGGTKNCVFDRLLSEDNYGQGFWIDGPANDQNTLRNSMIRNNQFQGARLEICYRTLIYNNIFEGNGQNGVEVSAAIGNRVYNNTFVKGRDAALSFGSRVATWSEGGYKMSSYANEAYGNVVYDNQLNKYTKSWQITSNPTDTSAILPPGSPSIAYTPNVSDKNLFFLSASHPWRGSEFFIVGGIRSSTLSTIQQAGYEVNSIWADPLFYDAANGDYRIKGNSPALNLGTFFDEASEDREGFPRRSGNVDAGAYEAPAGHWRFNESSGTTATDSSGLGRNGTVSAAAFVSGYSGNALSFNGNSYVLLASNVMRSSLGGVSFWFKTAGNSTKEMMFFYASVSGGDGFGTHNELHVHMSKTGKVGLFINGSTTPASVQSTNSYNDNQWHFAQATWRRGGTADLYIDGVFAGEVAHNANDFVCSGTSARVYLGRVNTGGLRTYVGLLDDVRLFDPGN